MSLYIWTLSFGAKLVSTFLSFSFTLISGLLKEYGLIGTLARQLLRL